MKKLWLTLTLLAVQAGCTGIPSDFRTPEVAFVSLRAQEVGLFEQRLEVRLLVRNPNSIELPVNGLDIDVELADEPFAHGVSAREFVVPARGEAEFDMIVTANAATALLKIAGSDRKSREAVSYRLNGKLSTRLGMLRSIPFDASGTVQAKDLFARRRKKD